MKQYSLLIIDDGLITENRKSIYDKVLGNNFNLYYLDSGSELPRIEQIKVHGYILDMVLEDWVGPNPNDLRDVFSQAIEYIGTKAPVFLVSSRWSPEVVNWLNNSKDKIKVEHFYEWREFHELAERIESNSDANLYISIRLNIERDLNRYYKRDLTTKKPDEEIVILQLSDLQFGDKATDDDSGLLQHNIPKYLKEEGIRVDFIAITGDIAYSGLPKEFSLAEEWIKKLCSNIFYFENYKPRLLLIPGNHDINLRLSSADNYEFKFKNKNDGISNKLVEIASTDKQHHFYGLIPFKEFAYSITGDTSWFTQEPHLCFVNDRFLHWGIRFIHLNSVVEQCPATPVFAYIPEKHLGAVLNAMPNHDNEKGIYTIIISHHGPEDFKTNIIEPDNHWPDIRSFIEGSRGNLFLYGHHHGFKTFTDEDEEGAYVREMRFHRTSTLLLNKAARESDQRRGFSVITLPRKNSLVDQTKIKIRKFELLGSGYKEI